MNKLPMYTFHKIINKLNSFRFELLCSDSFMQNQLKPAKKIKKQTKQTKKSAVILQQLQTKLS